MIIMNKEEERNYVFAQLSSLPNAFQYVSVTNYIENLERENKELKEHIEKYEHYCKTTGIEELMKENKILRENAEHNDKVVDKADWENLKLKKQLEEYKEMVSNNVNIEG